MLHVICWATIYAVVLWGIGITTKPWQKSAAFKLIFFPGSVVAAALHTIASLPCFGTLGRVSFSDGKPLHTFERPGDPKVPALVPVGVFLIATQLGVYILFLTCASHLYELEVLPRRTVVLPDLYPHDLLEGRLEVDASDVRLDLGPWLDALSAQPILFIAMSYGIVSLFASMSVSLGVLVRAKAVLFVLGAFAWVSGWLGAGFGWFTKGWWVRLLYVPDWWTDFSLFFALSVGTLGVLAFGRAVTSTFKPVKVPG